MPTPRKEQVSKNTDGYYHCVSRAVRRAYLCGIDAQQGCNYEHRRQWIVERLEVLAGLFAIDVCAYAVMSNHYHIVLHVNHQHSLTWTDEEVVQRWCTLFPPSVLKDSTDATLTDAHLAHLAADTEKVAL